MRSERATNGSALGVIVALGMTIVTGCASAKTSAFGVVDGKLARCPSAPHCVSTQAKGGHGVEPLPYSGSRDAARKRLVAILAAMPRSRIVTEAPDYVHAEVTSERLHYVDDVEIYLDDRAKLAEVRSSSRQGYWDFGANRRRVSAIRETFLAGAKGRRDPPSRRPSSPDSGEQVEEQAEEIPAE